jgi:hypothetical protein
MVSRGSTVRVSEGLKYLQISIFCCLCWIADMEGVTRTRVKAGVRVPCSGFRSPARSRVVSQEVVAGRRGEDAPA